MTNSTDVSDVKMTRFGYRVNLIRERHVRVKGEAKIASKETDWDDISLLRDEFVRSENFVPKKRFSFRWIEKQFVQVHPGENVNYKPFHYHPPHIPSCTIAPSTFYP